jgi:RNA polymerase sigma-70 factor (ECF subfamily)
MTITPDSMQSPNPTEWLDDHGDYLYRYALMRTRDSSVAEDLVQETLLEAMRSCEKQVDPASERAWLERILRNKLVVHSRRIAKPVDSHSTHGDERFELDLFETSGEWTGHWREDKAPVGWPVDTLRTQEFWQTFDSCLSDLPRRAGIAFTLREMDGLGAEEICEMLDISPGELYILLHCVRAKLRQALENGWFRGNDHDPRARVDQPHVQTPTIGPGLSYRQVAA